MIKAILLIFDPVATWNGIALDRKSFNRILFLYLMPMIVLSVAIQVAGRIYFNQHSESAEWDRAYDLHIFCYGVVQLVLDFAVVFICPKAIKTIAETFHSRNTFNQCFTLVAYGLSPLFLLSLLNAFPAINLWLGFGIGIALSVGTVYSGLPRVMLPDPPHAFGLYFMSAFLLAAASSLAAVLSWGVLTGKLKLLH
jgi:hypothetical protein